MRSPSPTICLFVFWPGLWCTPTREAATLLCCRALTAGGYLGSVRMFCHPLLCFSWIAFSCQGFSLSISFCFSQILCSIFLTSISSSSTVQCRRDRRRTSRCVPMATFGSDRHFLFSPVRCRASQCSLCG